MTNQTIGIIIFIIIFIIILIIVFVFFFTGSTVVNRPLGSTCSNTSECASNLVCSNSVCKVPIGGSCTTLSDCSSDATACISGACTSTLLSGPGGNAPCRSDLVVVDNVCFVPMGGACTSSSDCVEGLDCDNNICTTNSNNDNSSSCDSSSDSSSSSYSSNSRSHHKKHKNHKNHKKGNDCGCDDSSSSDHGHNQSSNYDSEKSYYDQSVSVSDSSPGYNMYRRDSSDSNNYKVHIKENNGIIKSSYNRNLATSSISNRNYDSQGNSGSSKSLSQKFIDKLRNRR